MTVYDEVFPLTKICPACQKRAELCQHPEGHKNSFSQIRSDDATYSIVKAICALADEVRALRLSREKASEVQQQKNDTLLKIQAEMADKLMPPNFNYGMPLPDEALAGLPTVEPARVHFPFTTQAKSERIQYPYCEAARRSRRNQTGAELVSTQSSALAPAYTCRICRKTLTLNSVPIIGEQMPQRLGRVAQALYQHFEAEHKKESVILGIGGQQYAGWRLTEMFAHNDADLERESNAARLQFRQHTKRVQISDETIEKQVYAHLGSLNADQMVTAIGLMKGLRDSLDEAQKPA